MLNIRFNNQEGYELISDMMNFILFFLKKSKVPEKFKQYRTT